MTNKELQKILKQLPDDAQVIIYSDTRWSKIIDAMQHADGDISLEIENA